MEYYILILTGAKKRKAAKKKKEQLAHHHSHAEESNCGVSINGSDSHGQGNGDKKAEDERSSDSSEVNSPVSDGNHPHHHHTFGERNGVPVKSGSSLNEPVAAGNKLAVTEGVIGEAAGSNNAVQQNDTAKIKDDFKSAQDVKNLEVSIEHTDSKKVLPDGSKEKEVDVTSASETSRNQEDAAVLISRVVKREMEATQAGNPEVTDMAERGSKENEDVEVVVSSGSVNADKKTLTPSGVADTSINQNGRTTATTIDADITKDSQFPESPENQPLVAPAPRLAQRTSWLSCCGLFGD